MNRNKRIITLIIIFSIIIALLGSTFAYLSWRSSTDQETVIDFSIGGDFSCAANGGGNLDEGDATLLPTYVNEESSANYIKREVKITPTINVEGQTIYMDLWLDIKELGEGLTNSQNLRYAFTTSSTSNTEGVVSTGNFYGKVAGDKINLLNGKDYADSNVDTYYLWIWLDAAQTDASTMNQAFKVSLNGSCSEGLSEGVFEVTSIKNTYQVVNVTAVNSSNKIVSYAITNTETQPVNNISDNIAASPLVNRNTNNGVTLLADSTSWIDIPDSEQGKIYNLEYTVNNAGTYYFWFKDDAGKIINKSLNISKIDTTGPKCVWSNISKNNLDDGDSATISLLCTDSETGMVSKDLEVSDFTITNNIITISKVEKSNITNGYKYTLTVVGGSTSGETTITLPKDKLSDTVNNLNTETVSGTILVNTVKTYAITYKDVGGTGFSGVHGKDYPLTYTTGSTTTLVNPTKIGYTFDGWYTNSDGNGTAITEIDGSQTGELVLYAKWTANTYTIRYNGNGNTSGSTASSTHTYNTEKELTANGFIKDGYTFVGWNTKADGTGTNYTDKEVVKNLTSNNKEIIDLYAKWEVGTYTVSFDGNMYSTTTRTVNGLTITYDSTNSYLTINGTPTTTGYNLNHISGLTFTENDKYNLTLSYVSGTVTNSGTGSGSTGVDVETTALANVSTRNYVSSSYITSGSATKTLTINSAGASEGAGLRLWLWFATPADWTFNNYKVKVNLTKDETANVTYGSTYGTLPTPKRVGFIFNGWYTGEKGTGTKVNSGDTVTITKDTTLYAKWTANTYTISFNGNMFSTTSRTLNGLTFTYDYDNSYLTINGTPTSTTTILSSIQGLNFNENDTYTLSLEYISGSYSYTGTNFATLSADVIGENGNNLSTRNYVAKSYPTSGSASGNLSITNLSSTSGTGLKFWMWANTPASQTFTNYKMKVNITKSDTKKVSYNSTYGSLPIPKRVGFTFDGWYTGEKGTGTKITDTSIVSANYNQTFYAKWKDNVLPYGTASLSLASGKFTLKLSNQGDDGSGLTGTYGFALTTDKGCSTATYTNQTGVSKEYSGSYTYNTTYYGCIKLTDNAGNIAYLSSAGVKYSYININNIYSTSGEQIFTVQVTGTYKLEVWGAQGGGTNGGYGAYSVGSIKLNKDQKLYINVGGNTSTGTGGYNGGGSVVENVYGGGGATHIATVSGLLSTLSSKTSNILIVAGGGGGQGDTYAGGAGGGISGVNGVGDDKGTGGTQTAGGTGGSMGGGTGTFGLGGSGDWYSESLGGGGGGYYGGGSGGGTGDNGGGGGGSGYIGNSSLTDKYMYCYNCTTSTAAATKTNTTTNVSSTPTANYAKSGAGAAKITATFSTNVSSLILTYNNNGGTGCSSKSIVNGNTYGDLCTPYRDGYSFAGWYTQASDGTQITSSTSVTVTANQTIYAHWTASTKPIISFSLDGNSEYVKGNITSTINVSKGSNELDTSTFKYIWSTDKNTTPDKTFMTGNSYTLEKVTGKYYLIAEACDKSDNCTKGVSNIFYVDNKAPTGTISLTSGNGGSITVTVKASDSDSGIRNYGYLIQTTSTCPTSGYVTSENNSYTFNEETSGTYYICTKITDNVGNESIISDSLYNVGSPKEYSESGEYTYVIPVSGTYKLEVWGAQGGSVTYSSTTYRGGYGGYSVGSISLTKGQKLYINVGGAGSGGISSSTFTGGYNGGGAITQTNGSDHYHASGGGATHIATVSGLLSTLSSKTSNILIVAGGGGGGYRHTYSANYASIGGEGGGISGTNSTTAGSNGKQGLGGTQTAGGKYSGSSETTSTIFGSFGKGGTPSASWGSAGGGGYYGGGASYGNTDANGNSGGGGGSGYIGNSSLTSKAMYCYNCTASSATNTKTVSTTCTNETATENCSKQGNGYAKITYIGQ